MPIEFEPTEWNSKCGRFEINLARVGHYVVYDTHQTSDFGHWDASDELPTFADAVAWCESRAKQQQGGEA